MKMTLAKALKHKNRIAQRIQSVSNDIQVNNSILAVNEPEVDIKVLDTMRRELVVHLIAVKTAIHKASDSIRADIFRLAEVKATIGFYRSLGTSHGKRQAHRFGTGDEFVEYKATIRKEEVDRINFELESEIDTLQEKLDTFNVTTNIEIDVPDAMNRPFAPLGKSDSADW